MTAIIDQGPLAVFLALAIAHALADFPLQTAYLAEQKNHQLAGSRSEWAVALAAHCLIHAGGVWLVTGSIALCGVEFFLHALIDSAKSGKRIGLLTDQMLHLVCKAGYVAVLCWCWC